MIALNALIALLLTLSSIFVHSEAFVVRRLIDLPALFTNQILVTTDPHHARVVTVLGLFGGSKGTNNQGMRKAPQHARFPVLRDVDQNGLLNLAFNALPIAFVIYLQQSFLAAQDKALTVWKDTQEKALAAEKASVEKTLAAEKASLQNTLAAEKVSLEKTLAAQEKALDAEKERVDKTLAAEKASLQKTLAAEKVSLQNTLAAEKASVEKTLAVWQQTQEKALAVWQQTQEKAIVSAREELKEALVRQNEIWSLRYGNYWTKNETVKEKDGLPPPSSPPGPNSKSS